jgi:DNA-directed RNA polymerase specialized sigma24 family protein
MLNSFTNDTQLIDCRCVSILEARRRGLSLADAEDISQEVTIRLWTVLTDGKPIKSIAAWTRRATSNLIIDSHRKRLSAKAGGKVTETLVDIDESRFMRV